MYVDAKALYSKGGDIQATAKTLNSNIVAVYDHLRTMHNTWKGQKWSEFAIMCNNCIETFESACRYLVTGLPNAVKVSAENYARAEGFSVGDTTGGTITSLTKLSTEGGNLELSDENGTTEKTLQNNINTDFQNIITNLNSISDMMKETTSYWRSEAATTARANFETTRGTIESTINQIKGGLNEALSVVLSNFVKTENTNQTNAGAF